MRGTLALCVIVTLSACGGSPTAPQPTSQPQPTQIVSQPAPEPTPPSPEEPAPAPKPEPPQDPPAPAPPPPTPQPPPAPAPLTFSASVSFAHWMGAVSLPTQFDVTVFPDHATIGTLRASVTLKQGEIVILTGDGFRFLNMGPINGQYQWTLDGPIGQAQGWMARQ